ncbi:MAG: HAMP domain-containing sensor histidine kinase [Actinomycetota bacterium]
MSAEAGVLSGRPRLVAPADQTAGVPAPAPPQVGHGRARRWARSLARARMRILGWYVVLMGVATVASLVLLRQVLEARLDDRVGDDLVQEVEELRALAAGVNPATSEPFGPDARAIFETFLARSVPHRDEAYVAFVGGEPFAITADSPVRLDRDPAFVDRFAAVPSDTLDEIETAAGTVRVLAVPLVGADGGPVGTFAVARFLATERQEAADLLRTTALIWGGILLGATLLAWLAAGRVLAPVRLVSDTARSITLTDLSRRLPEPGDDELAGLVSTFNGMLDRLERSLATQRAFIDDAGHELRTPITIIRGHLDVMGDDPADRADALTVIDDELDRMNRIVTDLLLLARAEQPDFLRPEPFDLGELVGSLAPRAAQLGERHWVTVVPSSPVPVMADRQRLTQAMINLLDNAVRHTVAGDRIEIGVAGAGGGARLWVADSGPGVEEAERAAIFERFRRGRGHGREGDGAGLGLAIVRAIAEAHGGTATVAPARPGPSPGARFEIALPARSAGGPTP